MLCTRSFRVDLIVWNIIGVLRPLRCGLGTGSLFGAGSRFGAWGLLLGSLLPRGGPLEVGSSNSACFPYNERTVAALGLYTGVVLTLVLISTLHDFKNKFWPSSEDSSEAIISTKGVGAAVQTGNCLPTAELTKIFGLWRSAVVGLVRFSIQSRCRSTATKYASSTAHPDGRQDATPVVV